MAARFGRRFDDVRVHTDTAAAVSAERLGADAYTVGRDIYFAAGRYAPQTSTGRRLLAHELTHTVQQDAASTAGGPAASCGEQLPVGCPDDPLEVEAERVAEAVAEGRPVPGGISRGGATALQRHPGPGDDQRECVLRLGGSPETRDAGIPTCREIRDYNAECRQETGYTGDDIDPVGACEQVTAETPEPVADDSGNTDPLNMANRRLTDADREAIREATGATGGGGPVLPPGLRFILHDTAANVSGARIAEQARLGRGPLGKGVAAWVPQTGAETITRPRFFETRRPTTSDWEMVAGRSAREPALRQVWRATSDAERTAALQRATQGLGLTAAEATAEQSAARRQLDARSGKIFTTAHWTVEQICDRVQSAGAAAVARPPASGGTPTSLARQVAALTTGCTTLAPIFTTRNLRLGSSTNVELVQQAGSHCRTSGSGLVPLSPFTTTQYQATVRLYLLAALEAGRFPEVVTHFWVDRAVRNRCDPRCFNLGSYYGLLQTALRHPAGARYGAVPNYGTTWGTHNVWWQDTVCGGPHP